MNTVTETLRQVHPRRTRARVALAGGLMLAAAGVIVQILTGVPGFPMIPPGPMLGLAVAILAGAAALARAR